MRVNTPKGVQNFLSANAPEVKHTWHLSVSDRTHPRVSVTLFFRDASIPSILSAIVEK